MSHMKPHVHAGQYFKVNTSQGTEVVPADLLGFKVNDGFCIRHDDAALRPYLEGTPDDPEEYARSEAGYLARMSAPGYLDCTAWTAHPTHGAAMRYLTETYDDSAGEHADFRDTVPGACLAESEGGEVD